MTGPWLNAEDVGQAIDRMRGEASKAAKGDITGFMKESVDPNVLGQAAMARELADQLNRMLNEKEKRQ
ncbi:hypothetical protein [Streptomyces halobius]|uniref:Uncharacterized protein n=1 Tax=Streptomyces halobius TaxID=2879846 RepID=A0ABY4M3K7_9ACTN|nr:hypothetical protein [Streptomyces halobius]UQA91768.1 hypothetical protein K9S39_07765 [Streptomyces halobius]